MIKKLKLGLLIAVLSVVGAVSAHASDITFSNDTSVSLTGLPGTFLIQAGSTATAPVTVSTTQLTVTVPAGETFILSSADRYTLANDQGLAQSCTGSANSVTITGLKTVVFTPTTVVCTPPAGGAGLSSGGGSSSGGSSSSSSSGSSSSSSSSSGSSSSTNPPVTLSITAPTTVTVFANIPGCVGTTGFSTVTGQSCANNVVSVMSAPSVIAGCVGTSGYSTVNGMSCASNIGVMTAVTYNLGAVTLKNGSKGAAVMDLQKLLNKILHLGLKIDGILGPKTIAVIKTWQKSHGLVADGLVGAKTKAMMNAQAEIGY